MVMKYGNIWKNWVENTLWLFNIANWKMVTFMDELPIYTYLLNNWVNMIQLHLKPFTSFF